MIHHRPTRTIVKDESIWPSTLGTNNAWLRMWFFHVWSSLPSNNNTSEGKTFYTHKMAHSIITFRCNLPIRVFQYYFVWCVNNNRCQYGIAQQLLHPPSSTVSFWNTLNWSRLLLFTCFGFIKDAWMLNTISFMKIDHRIGLACTWICAIDFTINVFSICNFFIWI